MHFHFMPTLTLSHGLFGLSDISVKRNVEQQVHFDKRFEKTMINKGVMNDWWIIHDTAMNVH